MFNTLLARRGALTLAMCLISAPTIVASAQTPPSARQVMQDFLNADYMYDDVFEATDDGGASHLQSGLHCPLGVVNAPLVDIMVYDTPDDALGEDVGCDYGRADPNDPSRSTAKHTIFAVKLPAGWTLEDSFNHYRDEMYEAVPMAEASGPSILFEGDSASLYPAIRSEEAFYEAGGRAMQTEIIVTVMDDWIIEIRSTRTSQHDVRDEQEAADNTVSPNLLLGAFKSFGKLQQQP